MKSKLALTKRRLLGVVFVCTILIAGLTIWLNMGHVAEAAVLEPHPGLVGWWRFDEGAGNSAKDSSEYGNDGTVYGATLVDGKYGTALSFDGINDYVTMNNPTILNPPNTKTVTIAFWCYVRTLSQIARLVNKENAYELFILTDKNVQVEVNNGNGLVSNTQPITLNTWLHITWVRDANFLSNTDKLYINGVLNYQQTGTTADINTNTENVEIGARFAGTNQQFDGVIDEVRIYNRALSAAEIQESFQKGPDFSSKLLAKVPKSTTQVIVTASWQGIGNINITIESPSKSYTEDIMPVYQKTVYSTSGGTSGMLNIKRISVSVAALSSDENWYVVLKFDDVEDYRITVEVQK